MTDQADAGTTDHATLATGHATYFHGGPWHQRLEYRSGPPKLELDVQCFAPAQFLDYSVQDLPNIQIHRNRRASSDLEKMLDEFAAAAFSRPVCGLVVYLHQGATRD